jgi:shikimate kinase
VFLDLSPDSIYQRFKADPSQLTKRPLLMNLSDDELIMKLKKLREERIDKYLAAGK